MSSPVTGAPPGPSHGLGLSPEGRNTSPAAACLTSPGRAPRAKQVLAPTPRSYLRRGGAVGAVQVGQGVHAAGQVLGQHPRAVQRPHLVHRGHGGRAAPRTRPPPPARPHPRPLAEWRLTDARGTQWATGSPVRPPAIGRC